MQIVAGMITAPRRVSYIRKTLASLHRAGWDAVTIQAEPESDVPLTVEGMDIDLHINARKLGPWPNYLALLRRMYESHQDALSDEDGVFVVQDDVTLARGLKSALCGDDWPETPEYLGVCSCYTASPNARPGAGWWQMPEDLLPRKCYGALAYLFPFASLPKLLANPPGQGTRTKIDQWVGRFCLESRLGYWSHSPSLAQHIGDVSSIRDHELQEINRPYREACDFTGVVA